MDYEPMEDFLTGFEPSGPRFYDLNAGRLMKLLDDGPWLGHIAYKSKCGEWVALRQATEDDLRKIAAARSRAGTGLPITCFF
jgi:hypothetical protein